MKENHPKLFISYSWSSAEHQQWVIALATVLRESGVDVILDKWDLKEGHDAIKFMEKMVSDPEIKKVAIICDSVYAAKADDRKGGVGTETQIITPEIYAMQDQDKFVAVLSERDEHGNPYLPIYYKSRIYIDLSDKDLYASNFEQLLRWIYGKPLYIKPDLGKKPSFLSKENPISLGTGITYRRALDAIRNHKEYAYGALEEYLSTCLINLERFRITNKDGEYDDKLLDNIEEFLPFRNEVIELCLSIAQYLPGNEAIRSLHRFFEGLIPYMEKPENVNTWSSYESDNFKFITHELFLYLIACLIKYEKFDSVAYLLRSDYYFEGNSDYGKNVMVSFSIFGQHLSSLHQRNKRLNLRRVSLHADLLKERSNISGLSFNQLMQTDLILFIRDCFDCLRNKVHQSWWPITLVYAGRYGSSFEVFARSQSNEYFNKFKITFGIQGKEDFTTLFEAFNNENLHIPTFNLFPIELKSLIGFDKLATQP